MKASYRFVLPAAGVAAALAAVAPAARAQRNQAPGPDTPRILVTAFRGDPEGGVKAADEIRSRISNEYSARTLWATSKKDIDATLGQSGYRADSALNPNDIKELAKLVRADEVIDGTVTKTAAGYRVSTRLFLPRDAALAQPLLTVESNDLGDVAKQVVREYDAARKQLKSNRECENDIRSGKLADAIVAARKGIAEYPKATIARLCLASAYQAMKQTADSVGPWKDSVISVTKQIVALDKQSRIAYQLQYDAYKSKSDTSNALQALVGLMNADPSNTSLRESVIAELVNSGKPEVAIPVTKQLVADNPGDPQYARTLFLVLGAAKNYKEAVPAGIAYVTLDTAAADSNYFFRQIQYLAADSMYAKAAEFAAQGAAKFPKSTTFLISQATYERRAGQVAAAQATLQRALTLDPKAPGANLVLAQIAADAGNADSVLKYVNADAAADANMKSRDAQFLLGLGSTAYRAGVASKKSDDFRRAIKYLQASDAMNPDANAKFLTAVSAFTIAQAAATSLQTTKSCADAKEGQEALVLVNTNMPAGGSVNPEVAKQILGAVSQYQPYFDASAKKFCK